MLNINPKTIQNLFNRSTQHQQGAQGTTNTSSSDSHQTSDGGTTNPSMDITDTWNPSQGTWGAGGRNDAMDRLKEFASRRSSPRR
ncbi:MAG: hypothetical protein KC800_10025 [Candidatus Eremiobacteraeota bacterium]|nr:hypothetical protein [Candidatus Eremiobacteraeota bacterium]